MSRSTDIVIKQDFTEEQKHKITQCASNAMYVCRVLTHASTCDKTDCFQNCRRIKLVLHHAARCTQTQCKNCTNLKMVVRIHSRKCQLPECPVPNCDHTRVINE